MGEEFGEFQLYETTRWSNKWYFEVRFWRDGWKRWLPITWSQVSVLRNGNLFHCLTTICRTALEQQSLYDALFKTLVGLDSTGCWLVPNCEPLQVCHGWFVLKVYVFCKSSSHIGLQRIPKNKNKWYFN